MKMQSDQHSLSVDVEISGNKQIVIGHPFISAFANPNGLENGTSTVFLSERMRQSGAMHAKCKHECRFLPTLLQLPAIHLCEVTNERRKEEKFQSKTVDGVCNNRGLNTDCQSIAGFIASPTCLLFYHSLRWLPIPSCGSSHIWGCRASLRAQRTTHV